MSGDRPNATLAPEAAKPARKRRRKRGGETRSPHSISAQGEPQVWLSAGALVVCLGMIIGLFGLIVTRGARTFWPTPVSRLERHGDLAPLLGEIVESQSYQPEVSDLESLPPDVKSAAVEKLRVAGGQAVRRRVRVETNEYYVWSPDYEVRSIARPEWALTIERTNGGRVYAELVAVDVQGTRASSTPETAYAEFLAKHKVVARNRAQRERMMRVELGDANAEIEAARLRAKKAEIDHGADSSQARAAAAAAQKTVADAQEEIAATNDKIARLTEENDQYKLVVALADGAIRELPMAEIVRVVPANHLSWFDKLGVYLARWGEFLSASPRNANSEGGVLPAIWGTVSMTLVMSIAVAPFGVLAALYLREYAKGGWIVSAVRIAINNLAGVPSIVFGVFGLGFFCYQVGGFIDGGPTNIGVAPSAPRVWLLLCFALALVAAGAFLATVYGFSSRDDRDGLSRRVARWLGPVLWLGATGLLVYVVVTTPYFGGFYYYSLPNPTFGKGGVLWAALTLSLLTLPVVIVATEEALSAVPNSMREGSYACGAGKWQTIQRIVLPHALPGVMTGMILAMARGAGEAAPLMLVGAVTSAPRLPVDGDFPYLHGDRSFMHLASFILNLGFQAPNTEAAKPMVFTSALLLISIVAALNLASIWLRARLRRAFQAGHF